MIAMRQHYSQQGPCSCFEFCGIITVIGSAGVCEFSGLIIAGIATGVQLEVGGGFWRQEKCLAVVRWLARGW